MVGTETDSESYQKAKDNIQKNNLHVLIESKCHKVPFNQ